MDVTVLILNIISPKTLHLIVKIIIAAANVYFSSIADPETLLKIRIFRNLINFANVEPVLSLPSSNNSCPVIKILKNRFRTAECLVILKYFVI